MVGMSEDTPTITSSTTLTQAAIAAIEQAASAQFGLRLRYCPEPEQLDQPEKPKSPKKPPTNKPAPKSKKPTGPELEALILADAQKNGETRATRFYDRWPESDHKRAKANVSNAFGRLVKAKKLTKEGHGRDTVYKPA